ncbi:DUF2807 domain-containing protein [bacterium]|nr:DUF2807 domain-containing protein [bacterium]
MTRILMLLGIVLLIVSAGCDDDHGASSPDGPKEVVYGNGVLVTDTVTIGDVKRLRVWGEVDARIEMGDTARAILTTDSNIRPHLSASNWEDLFWLKLDYEGVDARPTKCEVIVNVPSIHTITSQYLSNCEISGFDMQDSVWIHGVYGSDYSGELSSKYISIDLSGSRISMAGEAGECDLVVTGTLAELDGFVCKNLQLRCENGSTASVYCTDTLEIINRGRVTVEYYGNPKHVELYVDSLCTVIAH